MNLLRLCGAVVLILAPLASVSSLRAASIHKDDDESSLITGATPELVFDDTPGNHGQAYSFFQDGADFGDLGLIPGSFLFGGNTSYYFTGSQVVTIISAITDPGQSKLPLDDPRTRIVTFTLPDTPNFHADVLSHGLDGGHEGDDAARVATPEPPAGFLFLCSGLGLISLYATSRMRRISSLCAVEEG
jgi:hypothetical protein